LSDGIRQSGIVDIGEESSRRSAADGSLAKQSTEAIKRRGVTLAVDRLVSMIGHELNQPLNVIAMASFNGIRMSSRNTTTSTDFEPRFRLIQEETRRAGDLVHKAMNLTADTGRWSGEEASCAVSLLGDMAAPRMKRRGIAISVKPPVSTHAPTVDRWLLMFVVLCGLERLEEDHATTNDGSEAEATCLCEYRADDDEWTVGLRSASLLGGHAGSLGSPFMALLECLTAGGGGRVIDEPGRWMACLPAEVLS